MSESIVDLVDRLPADEMTVKVLKGQLPNQGVLDRAVAIARSEPGCHAVETNLVLVG